MKRFLSSIAIICFALVISAPYIFAQSARITHSFSGSHNAQPQLGREFWVPVMMIGDDQSSKSIVLCVCSPSKTVVNVAFPGSAPITRTLLPNKMDTIGLPITWEIKTSAVLENKAVHVWSNDADISVYLLSRITNSCEGFYVIPTIGWGREYVVAAFRAISDSLKHDTPSEFAIAANQDNTIVTITPSCDIRRETTPHFGDSTIAHAKGIPFSDTLKPGQTIQYKSTLAKDCTNYDVGGTIIEATHAIGVVAGCQNAIDNCTWVQSDYVAEMLPPVRTWGKTYYTSNIYARSTLLIGTKANQVIRRYDSATHALTNVCTIANAHDKFSSPYINGAARWESDTSFLLVQYILNGSNYANVVGEPVEQYKKNILFQADSVLGKTQYFHLVNFVVNANAVASTTLDGSPFKGYSRLGVDGKYFIYTGYITCGAHVLASDSGASVNVQGSAANEAYAWAGSVGSLTTGTTDQTPPLVTPQDDCYATRMMISDTGAGQSGVLYIALDTMFNAEFHPDPTWLPNTERTTTYYDMHVLDSTQPAQMRVSVYDYAGNKTSIFSEYDPQAARIAPPILDFGFVNVRAKSPTYAYDTLVNQGDIAFLISQFHFGTGDSTAFTIDSMNTAPLGPQERRLIKVGFWPKTELATWVTLVFGDECIRQEVLLSGSGATADFSVTSTDFGGVPIQTKRKDSVYVINNSTQIPVTITDVSMDSSEFTLLPSGLPLTIAPSAKKKIYLGFAPADCTPVISLIRVTSVEGDIRTATLKGEVNCDGVESPTVAMSSAYLIMPVARSTARAITPDTWTKPVTLEVENVLGINLFSSTVTSTPFDFDVSMLPNGAYFYRLSCGGESVVGKIVILR